MLPRGKVRSFRSHLELNFPDEARVYSPVGHCIYCLKTNVQLSDEHIIPYALWGDIILPKSSCQHCAKITGAIIEQITLRKTLINIRTRFGLRSRRKSSKPEKFSVLVHKKNGTTEIQNIETKQLPLTSWVLPKYEFPTYINQFGDIGSNKPKVICSIGEVDANSLLDLVEDECPITLEIGIDVAMFERAIAKIAHAYATAVLGFGNFEPCLNNIILNGSDSSGFLIGSLEKTPPPRDALLELSLAEYTAHNGLRVLAVHIRLFSYLGTPEYVVAVGSCDPSILENLFEEKYEKRVIINVRDEVTNEKYHISDYMKFEVELSASNIGNVTSVSIMLYPQNSHMVIPI